MVDLLVKSCKLVGIELYIKLAKKLFLITITLIFFCHVFCICAIFIIYKNVYQRKCSELYSCGQWIVTIIQNNCPPNHVVLSTVPCGMPSDRLLGLLWSYFNFMLNLLNNKWLAIWTTIVLVCLCVNYCFKKHHNEKNMLSVIHVAYNNKYVE